MGDSFHSSLLITYTLQAAIGLTLFFIFKHLSGQHQRKYLNTWSWAWIFFASSMIIFGLRGEPSIVENLGYWFGLLLSFLSLFLFYTYIVLFHGGIRELIRETRISHRVFLRWLGFAMLLSFLLVLIQNENDTQEAAQLRYFFRVGIRFFITSLSFIVAGLVLLFTRRLKGGLGHGIMSWSMILFGIEQGYYATVVFLTTFSITNVFPPFFGVIDLVIIFGIGFGMIIWLLEDEHKELKKANHELDRFVYSTSHDLRAPIASMLGLVNLARIEVKDENSLRLIGMMEQRVIKLDSVIADFLALSRSKNSEVTLAQLSLNALLDEVVSDVKFAKDAPSIQLIYDRTADFTFYSDYGILKTVLGNLFSNSVKYHDIGKPEPFIRVSYRRMDGKIQIDVEDNGQGIRTEHLDKIFDMFYRATATSVGTGLGLYIVKESLARLRGTIFVRSFYGSGSTFTILLPQPQ